MKLHLSSPLNASLAAIAVVCCFHLPAYGEGKGILTFLNAVPLETPTQFFVNGVSIKAEGFESGFCTSALLFSASGQSIVAKNGDLTSDPVVATPSKESSPLVVASIVLKEDSETKELKPKLVVLPAANLPKGKGWNYQIYYSSVKPSTDFKVNDEIVSLKGGQGKNFLGVGGTLRIDAANKTVASYAPEYPGNFFVILYDKVDGTIGSNIAQDSVYFLEN